MVDTRSKQGLGTKDQGRTKHEGLRTKDYADRSFRYVSVSASVDSHEMSDIAVM